MRNDADMKVLSLQGAVLCDPDGESQDIIPPEAYGRRVRAILVSDNGMKVRRVRLDAKLISKLGRPVSVSPMYAPGGAQDCMAIYGRHMDALIGMGYTSLSRETVRSAEMHVNGEGMLEVLI